MDQIAVKVRHDSCDRFADAVNMANFLFGCKVKHGYFDGVCYSLVNEIF